ncbi:bacteriophage lambda tail assembly I [Pseudomonas sp. TJI-51]|uniref:tail assembly protein n=1 Tax=unclassified Pseudomonas TaxID=196821 RepID=UPI0001FB8F37|nr:MULTISPECIES: tail assembly protein [unclassified Pseudomonas]EGB99171.1 bacteriophage lambda tail assembly I [Pseudomonas sp. TJI-51]
MAAIAINPIRTTVEMSGPLGKRFPGERQYQLDTGSTNEVFSALRATLDGFAEEIKRLDALGMRFAIYRNGKNIGEGELGRGGTRRLRIVPVIAGSKRAGLLQTIVGIALLIAGPFTGGATYGPGIALVAGGVIQMLSPQAKGLSQSAAPENLSSYAFGSAKNTTASGNPVPICIGERRWGGAIISASIEAQDKA